MEKYCGYRPKIALDIDDTLFFNPIVPNVIKEFGLDVTVHSWDMHELGEDVLGILYKRFLMPEYMCNLEPTEGTIEKVHSWHEKGYRMVGLTARKPIIQNETREMVKKYFPYIEDVFCAGEYRTDNPAHPIMNKGKNIALVKEGCHILIDDGGHNIEASLHLPWMKRYLISNEHTSYNWEVVRRYLINNPPTLHSKQNENRLIHIVKGIKEIDL